MFPHWSASGLVVHAPAKLNLFFEVLAKRDDGYHEVESLVCPVNLYDSLCFRDEPTGQLAFGCQLATGSWREHEVGLGEVPSGAENLVVRAVDLLRRRAGISNGATISLVKRIPSAAGLGGGSSDAAAALTAANLGWNLNWPLEQLKQLGAELGSDVPLFLAHGPAVCRGRGELVEPVSGLGALHFVVVRPPAGLSTAAVYGACRPATNARRVSPLLEAFVQGDLPTAGKLLFNRLESAAEGLSPWIGRLRREMTRLDVLGHQMSGSGTCYFGLCRHARHARRVARRLLARRIGIAVAVQGSC